MNLKHILTSEHEGYGGMYFIISAIVCASLMMFSLRLSWESQAIAICDNLEKIVALNTSANCYLSSYSDFNEINPIISDVKTGGNYDPLKDFNDLIINTGISDTGTTKINVIWNSSEGKVTLQTDEVILKFGGPINPHKQSAIIETY